MNLARIRSRFWDRDWHGAAEHSEVDGGPGIRRHRTGQRAIGVAEIGQRKKSYILCMIIF